MRSFNAHNNTKLRIRLRAGAVPAGGRSTNMAAAQPQVPKRVLGSTGIEVSVLGFGASPLGGVFEAIDESVAIQAVHDAFDMGINFFDTSPFYGATKSEAVLGRALKGLPRDKVVVSTKVGRYGADTFDFSAQRVVASVSESLQRLQLSYIDVIQCHDIEFGDLDQVVNETLPALQQLKQQGLVRAVGITGLPLKVLRHVLDKAPHGSVDVVLSYCHYCLNDSSLSSLLPYLKKKGVGVISASPLAMGLLTKQGPPSWHPAPAAVQQAAAQAADHAATRGTDISRLALQFALRNPDISSTLVGMAAPDVVRDNVTSALQALGVVPDPAAALAAEVTAEMESILAPVHNTTWPSGKPENN